MSSSREQDSVAGSELKTLRRGFLRSSTAVAVGAAALSAASRAKIARAAGDNTLRVALVGCGDRGTGAATQALAADSSVVITALGDLFEDRLGQSLELLRKAAPDRVRVDPAKCFLGFDAYEKVIASDVDVVLLCTPPGFRAQHLAAAVAAGKHSFVEIAAAVDVPGIRSFLASAELARQKNLAIVSGFCWRYSLAQRAVREQIRQGRIGEVRALYATYYRGRITHKHLGPRDPKWSDLEWQIRDWHAYTWLSGDVILLLSGAHSVDKMSWWLDDRMPIKAVGVGGCQVPGEGNVFDHGMIAYEYEGGIRGFLGCRGVDGGYTENADYIIGTKGVCTIGRGRVPQIAGENPWRYDGPINNMYQTEHDELFASIRSGKPINDGVRMASTTLMTMLGRMATYTGQEISWEQALNSQERLMPERVDWSTKVELPPLAVPGITKLI